MVALTWKGEEALIRALADLPQAVRGPVRLEALRKAAEPMRQRMAALAPRGPDAPHIADSMTTSVVKKIDGVALSQETESAIAIGPSKDFFYGIFWEFGWEFHPTPHPFVRPAYDAGAQSALTAVGEHLWAAITARGGSRS